MTIDELGGYGMEQMDEEAVTKFLTLQSHGVLGLPTENGPYLLPMSYGFDGNSRLYFWYVVGSQSRKAALSDQATTASFLVYRAEMFHWRSVLLTGTIRRLPEEDRETLPESRTPAWRPEVIETASETEATRLYEFRIDDRTGVRHDLQAPSYDQRSSRDE
ncbi:MULTISPECIES: pyridoxamine 5'-phosphate oxidase family protein [unclassified Natrinema]|uniref:pyridoxamine 5'-phosphate oxidase family protein n=1 Tax=unclassified Natrinema TaxID=2622230 RepID=UPI00026D496C|nr:MULTISPECIES: pyridoxamine 5'-phosphate oxidase family protein [unclassified Natrinema]AFO57066.1 pyridoxamine 5'-phosphate oxidase-related FMN-binding protein [Natrinema sp. J7-2]